MSFVPKALDTTKVLEGLEIYRKNKQECINREIAAKQSYLKGYEDAISDIEHICRYRNWEYVEPAAPEQEGAQDERV